MDHRRVSLAPRQSGHRTQSCKHGPTPTAQVALCLTRCGTQQAYRAITLSVRGIRPGLTGVVPQYISDGKGRKRFGTHWDLVQSLDQKLVGVKVCRYRDQIDANPLIDCASHTRANQSLASQFYAAGSGTEGKQERESGKQMGGQDETYSN